MWYSCKLQDTSFWAHFHKPVVSDLLANTNHLGKCAFTKWLLEIACSYKVKFITSSYTVIHKTLPCSYFGH